MSHTVTIDLVIKDMPALKSACKELGLEFLENKTTYHVYAKDAKGLHAIKVPGTHFEVGLERNPKGEGLVMFFDDMMQDKIGVGGQKIKQLYAVHAAINAAKAKGWMVNRQAGKNGSIRLQLTGV